MQINVYHKSDTNRGLKTFKKKQTQQYRGNDTAVTGVVQDFKQLDTFIQTMAKVIRLRKMMSSGFTRLN